jgi:hypothetical protein
MKEVKKLAGKLLPRPPRKVARPEQELRFTRSRQALTFLAAGIIGLCVACGILIKALPGAGNVVGEPASAVSPLWALVPLAPATVSFWLAAHCLRHAFIILTPLGIELFPFWRPARNMQVIYWAEIETAIISPDLKIFTIKCRGSGIMATLAPISRSGRVLLKHGIEGRMERQ